MRRGGTESEPSPERIQGSDLRVPAIIGQGTGSGFQIVDLTVPDGWEKSSDFLKRQTSEDLVRHAGHYADSLGLGEFQMKRDDSGLVSSVALGRSSVQLDTSFGFRDRGVYRFKDVTDIKVSIALQSFVARFINGIRHELGAQEQEEFTPVVEGVEREHGFSSYFSRWLAVPKRFMESDEVLVNDIWRARMELRAANIAGRFGLDLESLDFDERGLLRFISIEGDRAMYYLDRAGGMDSNVYTTHNIDHPRQALACHGIAAEYINHLLQSEYMKSLA